MASRLVRAAGAAGKTLRKTQRKGPELFVKKISWVTGAKELTDHFSQFGKITNITLPFDLRTGLHKGFAFISFENDDFDGKIKKFGAKHIIDDEEVMCSLVGEERSLLLSDANATPLGNRKAESTSEVNNSKENSGNEVSETESNSGSADNEMLRMNSAKGTDTQEAQKQGTESRTVKNVRESESGKLLGKRKTSKKPVITRLTDPIKESDRDDGDISRSSYTVVRLSKNSKMDAVRNSFKSHNGVPKIRFGTAADPFRKRQFAEDSSNYVKEAEPVNLKNLQSNNSNMQKNTTVETVKETGSET